MDIFESGGPRRPQMRVASTADLAADAERMIADEMAQILRSRTDVVRPDAGHRVPAPGRSSGPVPSYAAMAPQAERRVLRSPPPPVRQAGHHGPHAHVVPAAPVPSPTGLRVPLPSGPAPAARHGSIAPTARAVPAGPQPASLEHGVAAVRPESARHSRHQHSRSHTHSNSRSRHTPDEEAEEPEDADAVYARRLQRQFDREARAMEIMRRAEELERRADIPPRGRDEEENLGGEAGGSEEHPDVVHSDHVHVWCETHQDYHIRPLGYRSRRDEDYDVDSMSYEELLALGERIGPAAVSLETRMATITSLPTRTVTAKDKPDRCAICLMDYVVGDVQRTLMCFHAFHLACIDQWLQSSLLCPVCKHATNMAELNVRE